MFDPGQRITWSGQVGVLLGADGDYAQVSLPDSGVITVPVDELAPYSDDPNALLVSGKLDTSTLYRLRLRAEFLRHAYRFDPLAGLSNARVEPKHHQVYVAHRVTRKPAPRMILADEVGLGKTIEAGLILKELRAREAAARTLILVPANLATQWQQELRVKFNEEFTILDGDAARHFGRDGSNPFSASDSLIASLAFASRAKRIEEISELPWDLVIFDEAHRVRINQARRTKAYELAEQLRDNVHGLLLLTATPMQLGLTELWGLVDLVEPGLYPSVADYRAVSSNLPRLNGLMRDVRDWPTLDDHDRDRLRRDAAGVLDACGLSKADLDRCDASEAREDALDRIAAKHPLAEVLVRNRRVDVGGFTMRSASRILVELTPEEQDAQEAVTDYLRNTYNLVGGGNNALGFLLVTYHKMLASSSAAIYASLKRRRDALQHQLELDIEAEIEWTGAQPTERRELLEAEDATAGLEGVRDRALALETEIVELNGLLARLGKLRDSKALQLVKLVDQVLSEDPDEKVLIFTQFIDTQRLLEVALKHRGFTVDIFNGRMSVVEKDAAIERFRRRSQVLVSTEAGGEGRNLQFCHVMFNFDLPWNPMRVEQRIGRIDRIGQTRPVSIVNLAKRDTIEERVLAVLSDRIRLFEESVGSLDPILGEVERDIENLVLLPPEEFAERFSALEVDLERKVKRAITTQETLHDFALERNSFRRDETNQLLGQRSLATAEDLRGFVAATLDYEGGNLAEEVDGRTAIVLSSPLAQRLRLRETTHRGTFAPETAIREEAWDFFAMGHPVVEGLLNGLLSATGGKVGAREVDGAPEPLGIEVFYELVVTGMQHAGRFVRHVIAPDLQVYASLVDRQFSDGDVLVDLEPPAWTPAALEASRQAATEELTQLRDAMRAEFEDLRQQRLTRAQRVAEHKIRQNEDLIVRVTETIEELEASDDDMRRRILPAQRARVTRARQRNRELEADLERDILAIRAEQQSVSLRLVAAGLVVQP